MGNLLHNRDVLVLFVCSWVICTLNGTLHAEPPHPPSSSQLTIDRLTQAHSLELEDIHSSELVGIRLIRRTCMDRRVREQIVNRL